MGDWKKLAECRGRFYVLLKDEVSFGFVCFIGWSIGGFR